jgi:hypothetical protein
MRAIRSQWNLPINGRLFVLGYTDIEPFDGHVQMEVEAQRHFHPIVAALTGKLEPSSVFELHLPVNAFQGSNKRGYTSHNAWAVARAPTEAEGAAPGAGVAKTKNLGRNRRR